MSHKETLVLGQGAVIRAWASVGGKKEGEGPLSGEFDLVNGENSLGQDSWEQSECQLQQQCAELCLRKGEITPKEVDLTLGGDLQAQCTATAYAMRSLGTPYAGLYGACSTMAQGLALGACLSTGGLLPQVLVLTSSHFCAAEREFRTPLEYGGQRTPTAQWTATAAGACLLSPKGDGPRITALTFGRVVDLQITDINNMGAAMAPAAAQTILRHLKGRGTRPGDYDAIVTGDLGQVGSRLLHEILEGEGLPLPNHRDCGLMLYDLQTQQVGAGGSGAGCSASVLCAHFLPRLAAGEYRRILFLSTGALMSQTTFLQGESIPGLAHAIELEGCI